MDWTFKGQDMKFFHKMLHGWPRCDVSEYSPEGMGIELGLIIIVTICLGITLNTMVSKSKMGSKGIANTILRTKQGYSMFDENDLNEEELELFEELGLLDDEAYIELLGE